MKLAILLMFIFLAGCGTISRTVSKAYDSFFNDETVSSEDKKEVLLETTRMQEAYKQFRMYHYCAIGLGAFGIASVAFRVTSTRIGLGCIAGAVGLSAWDIRAGESGQNWLCSRWVGAIYGGLHSQKASDRQAD